MPFNFSNFTSGLGRAASSLGNAASRGASSLASGASRAASGLASAAQSPAGQNLFNAAKGIGGALAPAFAPQLSQMIGNRIGGQAGQMISQMGQSFGQPQQGQGGQTGSPMNAQDLISQGHEMGQNAIGQAQGMAGNAMQGMINQYVPQQFQGMNAGNAGNMFGGMAGQFLNRYLPQSMQGQNGQPGFADMLGGMAGNMMQGRLNQYVPEQYRNINIGDAGNYAAQQGANLANRGLDAASQYASQQADNMGFANGGSVGGMGGQRFPHLNNPYQHAPQLSLRDFSEMIPAHGGMY